MIRHRSPPICALAAILLAAPAVHAQQWLVNSAIQNQITETALCDDSLRKHERLPDVCAKYPQYAGAATQGAPGARPQPGPRPATAAQLAALRFTPTSNNALQTFVQDLGKTPQERQQLLQAITATKASFEQQYATKGWKNNVAGAYAFFIGTLVMVWSGDEPAAAAQGRLFGALSTALAQSPDLAGASNADKAALYDTLIASASLPLLLYVDGTQQQNNAEIQQARTLASEYSRKIMHSEPQALVGMLRADTGTHTSASAGGKPVMQAAAPMMVQGLDGRYDCQMLWVRAGASFSVEYRPIGLWFSIGGNSYSANGGDGRIDATAGDVGFHGGPYNGWRGARINNAIVFRKDNHANPQAGEGIRNGDIRCGRH